MPSLNLKRKLKYNDDSEDEKRQITEHTLIEEKVLDDKKGKETKKGIDRPPMRFIIPVMKLSYYPRIR